MIPEATRPFFHHILLIVIHYYIVSLIVVLVTSYKRLRMLQLIYLLPQYLSIYDILKQLHLLKVSFQLKYKI